jgi:acetyl-CoA synthetase
VAVEPDGEGAERLVVFAVLSDDADTGDLRREVEKMLASELNPLFKIHDLVIVDALPRTASNKLMRRKLRAQHVATIEAQRDTERHGE